MYLLNQCSFRNFYYVYNLYFLGIFSKLKEFDYAKKVFKNGENMLLSLIATVVSNGVLSLDELPGTVTNSQEFVLSGAICLKDEFPVDSVDAFIRWKSLFTELRAVLIQVGLRNAYRSAFLSLEKYATQDPTLKNEPPIKEFKAIESQLLQKCIVPVINALYQQKAEGIQTLLNESDIVLDYTFNIYNPEYRDPPESQACGIVIRPQDNPFLFRIDNQRVYKLLIQLPKAIYELWSSYKFHPIMKDLADALFPPNVCEYLLKPSVKRLFICPDVDLLCFPIDQLPITDSHGTTKPLHEWFSVTFLSSPRELLRKSTVMHLQKMLYSSGTGTESGSDHSSAKDQQIQESDLPQNDKEAESICDKLKCYIIANPNFKLELSSESETGFTFSFKSLLSSLDSLLGLSAPVEDVITDLVASQKEAENVHLLLSMNDKLEVKEPIVGSEATISRLLDLQSPFVLHIATHGYSGKQVSVRYKGNFWTDNSSGILLAGASTFRNKYYSKMDPKAGTGHMNAVAACGMQLDNTRLVFISTCNSSVGSRPTQEMPNSFTQAVRAAGAETVIATLWTVSDSETAEFVSYFYDHFVNTPHCRPSEAISYAKQVMKAAGKSMFYWGAFVCNGLDNPL